MLQLDAQNSGLFLARKIFFSVGSFLRARYSIGRTNRYGSNHCVGCRIYQRNGGAISIRHVSKCPMGVMAIKAGRTKPGIVALTVLVAVSITDTVFVIAFAT